MLITLRGLGVNYLLNSLVMFLWWYHNFEEDRRSCRLPGQTPVQLMPCSHQFKQVSLNVVFLNMVLNMFVYMRLQCGQVVY